MPKYVQINLNLIAQIDPALDKEHACAIIVKSLEGAGFPQIAIQVITSNVTDFSFSNPEPVDHDGLIV